MPGSALTFGNLKASLPYWIGLTGGSVILFILDLFVMSYKSAIISSTEF